MDPKKNVLAVQDSNKGNNPKTVNAPEKVNKTDAIKNANNTKKENNPVKENQPKGKKKNRRRIRQAKGEDRYFGRFHCNICNKMWESAHVYTFAGSKKVKYKQRCKNCNTDEAWYFPYDIDLILCSYCNEPAIHCVCTCGECGKLWYRPRGKGAVEKEDEYCSCDKRSYKKNALGDKIDSKKPHPKDLCQRCRTGRPCWGKSVWEG